MYTSIKINNKKKKTHLTHTDKKNKHTKTKAKKPQKTNPTQANMPVMNTAYNFSGELYPAHDT